jgi:hypothetical protein
MRLWLALTPFVSHARAAAPRRRMSDSRSGHLEIRIDRRRVSSASVILQSAKSA